MFVPKGTLLLTNSATIGVPMFMGIDGYIHDGFLAFPHFPEELDIGFFFLQLRFLSAYLTSEARGLAQLNLNSGIVRRSPLAIPPLAEQKRIVARVDQLIALIDDLEAKQTKKRDLSARFTKASLDALTTAESPEDFDTAWTRVVENFATTVDSAEKVADIRASILELAATARLVAPLPGSAARVSELFLARAIADRLGGQNHMVEERGWVHGPLAVVLQEPLANGRSVPDDPRGFPVLRLSALRGRFIDFSEKKLGAWTEEEAAPYVVKRGDILFVRGNGAIRLVGRACMAGDAPQNVAFPDTAIRARLQADVMDPKWLWYVWESRFVRRQLEASAKTTAGIFKISQDVLCSIKVPIPTLFEQHRIVAKVEHLMKLCDELEAKLGLAEDRASKLVEAVVQELVA